MTFLAVPGKHAYSSAYPPIAFLDALRADGWEPGRVPESVVFTYAHLEFYLAHIPEQYEPNHMLGVGPGRFFLVNSTDGRVAVNCLGIGAPAAAAQLEIQVQLGVKRCLSIGTAGGLQLGQQPGDIVLLTQAIREEGTSYHYLPPDAPAVPDNGLTAQLGQALDQAGLTHATGSTVTTDAPYRTTPDEIRHHRLNEVSTVEMEAAALFAVSQVRSIPTASAVVIDSVAGESGSTFLPNHQTAAKVLHRLLPIVIDFLDTIPS